MTITDQAMLLLNSEALERFLVVVGILSILWWAMPAALVAWLFWVSR